MADSNVARTIAFAVTTLIKLGGLGLAANEALFVDPPRDSIVFAISAFMMAGATGLDGIVDRFLGGGSDHRSGEAKK